MRFLLVLKTGLISFSQISFGDNLFTLQPTVTKFSRGLEGGKTFLRQFGSHERFVTIATRAYTYISPILIRILTKLGRLVPQMRISQRRILLHGKFWLFARKNLGEQKTIDHYFLKQ